MAVKKAKEAKEAKGAKKAAKVEAQVEESEIMETEDLDAPLRAASHAERAPASQGTAPKGNFVYVGQKGVMAYVLAVVTQFGSGAPDVIIKARGKTISRAVDVAEIVRHKYPEVQLVGINISTEQVQTEDGRPLNVSAIEIKLTK